MEELPRAIVERARRGDEEAFRLLVVRYQRPVHAVIARILVGIASWAEVEDLAQETFLKVLAALPAFVPEGPGRTTKWILTIATRVALDARRRRPQTVEFDPLRAEGPEALRPDVRVRGYRAACRVANAMTRLPPAQRAVFVLREYHDFDYQEIADALAIPVPTVKSRLHRARLSIRKQLEDVDYAV